MHSAKTDRILNSKEFKQHEQENFDQLIKDGWAERPARNEAFHLTVRQFVNKEFTVTLCKA